MYDQAVGVVLKNRRASISLVQRHCASATTAPRGCWNRWRNPGSCPAWRPTATATSWSRRGPNDDAARAAGRRIGCRRSALLALRAARRRTPTPSTRCSDFVRDVKTGRAAFTQIVTSPDGAKKKILERHASSSRARTASASPTPSRSSRLIVADGQKVWIYDADLNQVSSRKLGAGARRDAGRAARRRLAREGLRPRRRCRRRTASSGRRRRRRPRTARSRRCGSAFAARSSRRSRSSTASASARCCSSRSFEANVPVPRRRFRFTPPPGADVIEQ